MVTTEQLQVPPKPGQRLRLRLPGRENYIIATVERCSAKMKSCYVETEDGIVKVDLTSTDFEVLRDLPRTSPSTSDVSKLAEGVSRDVSGSGNSADSESLPSHALLADVMATIDSRDPDDLLRPSEAVSTMAKQAVKECVESIEDPPHVLHVDGFDAEQIWVQLDNLSRTALRRVKRVLQRSSGLDSVIPVDVEEALDELLASQGGDGGVAHRGDDGGDDLSLGRYSGSPRDTDEESEDFEEDDDFERNVEEYDDGGRVLKDGVDKETRRHAPWEDEYLNMDEMEAFLEDAENEYAREANSDPEDEALDNMLDDMMEEVGRPRRGKEAELDHVDLGSDPLANAKYDDFFAPISADATKKLAVLDKPGKKKKRVHFIEAEDTDGESEEDGDSGRVGHYDDFADAQFEGDQYSASDDDMYGVDADHGGSVETGAGDGEDLGVGEEQDREPGSRHQLRLDRMSYRIQKLEDEALGEREWYMRGEVSGSHRPMNSALEVDLDFETTMKPPPQPTEETTQSLEDLIKQRIADHHFDDVIPILPAKEEKKKTVVELDDVKSTQGLGQIYEDEYMASQGQGVSEDKEQPIRDLAKKQFIDLCAKLDQLSHGQFRPLPAIEEVTFKVDVPAIMMEEATPAFVSDASMRKPEEVFKPGQSLQKSIVEVDEEGEEKTVTRREGMMQPGGVAKSEAELTREDRKRRRAAKKRASKKRKMAVDADRIQKSMASGKAVVSGRKSEESAQMLRKLAVSAKTSDDKRFKSRDVFARLQQARTAELREGGSGGHEQRGGATRKPVHLKL